MKSIKIVILLCCTLFISGSYGGCFSINSEMSAEDFTHSMEDAMRKYSALMMSARSENDFLMLPVYRMDIVLNKAASTDGYVDSIKCRLASWKVSEEAFTQWVYSNVYLTNLMASFQILNTLSAINSEISELNESDKFREYFNQFDEDIRVKYYKHFYQFDEAICLWSDVLNVAIEMLVANKFPNANIEQGWWGDNVVIPVKLFEKMTAEDFLAYSPCSSGTSLSLNGALILSKKKTLSAVPLEDKLSMDNQREEGTATQDDKGGLFFVAKYMAQYGVNVNGFVDLKEGRVIGDIGVFIEGMTSYYANNKEQDLKNGFEKLQWSKEKVKRAIEEGIFLHSE